MAIDNQKQAAQATALIVGKILASLSEAIIPIMLVRFLPINEVGILSAVLLIYTLLAPLFATAFPDALMYFLPTRGSQLRRAIAIKVATIMLAMGILTSIIMFLLGMMALLYPDFLAIITDDVIGGVSAIGPSGLKYLVVLAIFPLSDFPARMLPNLLIIEDRAKTAATISVIKSIVSVVAILVPVLCNFNLWIIITIYSLSGFFQGFLLIYYLVKLYPPKDEQRLAADISTRKIIRFAVPMGITEAMMLIYNKIDLLLISLAFAASMVAQYRIGAWQIPFVTSIAYSVGSVYAPHFRQLMSENKAAEAIKIWKLSIEKVALISVPLGLVFVVSAEELIELLFTRDYLQAANIFRLYCLLTVGRVAAFGPVLVAAGRPDLIFRVAAISFTANILFSLPAMFLLGIIGPAVGTVLAFMIHVYAFCWCIGKVTGVSFRDVFPLRSYLKTLAIAVFAGTCAFIFKINIEAGAAVRLAGVALIMVSVFPLTATFCGQITRDDWNFISRVFCICSLGRNGQLNELQSKNQ